MDLPKMSRPAHDALALAGIKNLKDISKHTEKELLKLHGFGPKSIKELRVSLKEAGLSFKQEVKK